MSLDNSPSKLYILTSYNWQKKCQFNLLIRKGDPVYKKCKMSEIHTKTPLLLVELSKIFFIL